MTEQVFHFTQGSGPLLVSMPHVGTHIPSNISDKLSEHALKITDTDWHVDQLYNFLGQIGASVLRATHSRYIIDLNRGADGTALYPGQSETELCPTTGFDSAPLYRDGMIPDETEILKRRKAFWLPYHQMLKNELERIKQQYGYAILWDAHSIKSRVPRFFDGQLPDLNIGTGNGISCDPGLAETLLKAGQNSDYSTVLNGRFKGGYITRNYGDPTNNIHAIQMEISQFTYMDEDHPFPFREEKAELLRPTLKKMITKILDYLS